MPRAFRRNSVDKVSRRERSRSGKIRRARPEVLNLEDRLLLSGSTLGWTGASGTDTNWSNPANWTLLSGSDTFPQDGDILKFSDNSTYPKTMTDNIALLSVSLEFLNAFGGATYTLNTSAPGNQLSLTDNGASALIVPAGDTAVFNMPVTFTGTATLAIGGTANFSDVTVASGATATVSGGGTETFNGATAINGGFSVASGAATFSGTGVTVNAGGTFDVSNTTLSSMNLNGGTLTSTSDGNQIAFPLTISAPSTFDIQAGTTLIDNTASVSGAGPITLLGGSFRLGTSNFANTGFKIDTGTLSGTGAVGNITNAVGATGAISPGSSPGDTSSIAAQSLVTVDPVTFNADIGTGGASDTMTVIGPVDVTGLVLNLNLLPGAPSSNVPYMLISQQGNSPIIGEATVNTDTVPMVVPNGGQFTLGGSTFVLYYTGGDGNDLTIESFSPVATNDTYSTPMNDGANAFNMLLGNVVANDTVPTGFAPVVVTTTAHGQLLLDTGNGAFTYVPDTGFYGVDTFTYHLVLASQPTNIVSNDATVTIFVNNSSLAPKGLADIFAFGQDAVPPDTGNVLTNDIANSGNTADLTAQLVSTPQNALSFSLNPDGTFNYTPMPGFVGSDTFQYVAQETVTDPNTGNPVVEASQPTTVTILIQAANVPPVANDDPNYATYQNQTLSIQFPGVIANDTDPTPGPNALKAFLMSQPSHGTVLLNADGSFTYTPDTNYLSNGTPDTFTYVVSDGVNVSNVATASINVKAGLAPPIGVPDIYSVDENGTLSGQNVLTNDIDLSGNALTAQLVNGPVNASAFTFNADGTFTYAPAAGFVGVDSFSYRALDAAAGTFSDVTTVSIIVNAVNMPTAVPDNYATYQNQALSVSAPGVLANDTDTNPNATLTAIMLTQPSHGTVLLNADGSFVYTPFANYLSNGTPDTFTYAVTDGVNTSAGANVSINVLSGQVSPIGVPNYYSIDQNSGPFAGPSVLTNDISPSGNPLTAQLVNGPTNASAFTLNPDGTFSYTPTTGFVGTDTFTYRAFDAIEGTFSDVTTVSINVNAVNMPTATDDNYATFANQNLSVSAPGVLTNDTDTNPNATLQAILLTQPSHGTVVLNADGSFTYIPVANYVSNGTPDTFTYQVTDGFNTSGPATVSINVLPTAPTAVDDSYTLNERTSDADPGTTIPAPGVLVNDTIPNNGVVALNVVNAPIHGSLTLNPDGSFTYTPFTNYFGTDSFTYFVTDGGLNSNSARVTLNIVAHYKPVAKTDSYSVNENTTLTVGAAGVLGNDTNVEGDKLQAVLVDGPKHGTITLNSDGSLSYTPDQNYSGPDSFTYKAVNGTLLIASDPVTDNITVNYVNVSPIANNDTYTIEQDSKLTVPAPGVLGNDVDPDGPQSLTAVLVNTTQNGSLTLNSDGSFTYQPNPRFSGVDTFTYKAFDGDKYSAVATVTINVQFENPTTVTLDSNSDTGISNTDHITRNNTPTYTGTTRPNLTVKLYVMGTGQSSLMLVGTTTADSTGHYALSTSVLPDGAYQVFAEGFRADGTSTGLVYGGPLVIDTVAPVVNNAMITPRTGQIYVTFQDNMSGMAQPTLNNIGNYSLWKIYRSTPRAFAIAHASASPSAIPSAPQTVALDSVFGNRLPHGRYLFAALSGGVEDVAGNALNGAFNGRFPTGSGQPGSNFLAQFNNDGHRNSGALPATQFVPIVSHSYSASPTPAQGQYLPAANNGATATPGGPLANLKLKVAARRRHR